MRLMSSLWLLSVALFIHPAVLAAELSVKDAWIRPAPPTANVLAGYLTLRNNDSVDHRIVGARSPAFEKVELHRSVIEDGMARMLPQSELVVPAGKSLVLEPGGYHLMLIAPHSSIGIGDSVKVTLMRADGGEINVTAEVRQPDNGHTDMHHHHHH